MTLVRVKRRRNETPLDRLVVESERGDDDSGTCTSPALHERERCPVAAE